MFLLLVSMVGIGAALGMEATGCGALLRELQVLTTVDLPHALALKKIALYVFAWNFSLCSVKLLLLSFLFSSRSSVSISFSW